MQGVSGTGKSGNRWYYYQCANMKKRIFWNGML